MNYRSLSLAAFVTVVLGGGILIGYTTPPDAWYSELAKPSFNPPGWIFGPVWSVLYICIAVAGWRLWLSDREGAALKLWLAQMALNFLWSPLFFAAHRIDWAFAVILMLLATILLFIRSVWARDRVPALLFLPYAAWVAFASALNGSILFLNM